MKRLVVLFSVLLALSTALFSLTLMSTNASAVTQTRVATTNFSNLEVGTIIKGDTSLNPQSGELLGGFVNANQQFSTGSAGTTTVVEDGEDKVLEIATTSTASKAYVHTNLFLSKGLVPGETYTISITYKFTENYVKPSVPSNYGYLCIRNSNGFGDLHVLDKETGENQGTIDANGWYTYTTTVTTKTAGGTNLNKILILVTANGTANGEAAGIYLKSFSIIGEEEVPLEEEIEVEQTATTDFSNLSTNATIGSTSVGLSVTKDDLLGGFAKTNQQFSTDSKGKTTVVEESSSKNLLITTTSTASDAHVHVNFFLGQGLIPSREYTITFVYKFTDNYVQPATNKYGNRIVIRNTNGFGDIKVCDTDGNPQGTLDANGYYTYTTTVTTKAAGGSNLNKFILLVSASGTDNGEATGIYVKALTVTGPGIIIKDNSVASVVRINYWNPDTSEKNPSIALYKGVHTDEDNTYRERITDFTSGEENGIPYIEVELKRGVYYAKSYYRNYKFTGDDAITKYFYVVGEGEPIVIDICHPTMEKNNWSEAGMIEATDEVLANFAGTDDLVGYEPFDTPTFTKHADNPKEFMTNTEACEYVDALDASSNNLYVYYPFGLSEMGNKTPVMVFTKTDLTGKTFEEAGTIIRALKKEVLMTTGGLHGNEPAGMEGNLALAKELCGVYGSQILDDFGAIVIMPIVSVDNNQRYARSTTTGINPNRELLRASIESTQNQIATYNNFMPTVYVDCHEDYGRFNIDEATGVISEELMDVAVRYSSVQNSPLYTVKEGEYDVVNDKGYVMMVDALDNTRALGLRSEVYYVGTTSPGNSKDYPIVRGSYSFIVEVMRISSGKTRYARAVFAMKEALKSIINSICEYDGALAEHVYSSREALESVTKYDANRLFALEFKTSGNNKVTFPYPTLKPDGTYANETRTYSRSLVDTVTKVRAMPTAYVVDANNPNIDEILTILDIHGIKYTKLKDGSSLLLKKYSGGYTNTTIGASTNVTFENGAYAVTLNCADAYLIPYLFEPDCVPFVSANETTISFAHMGYITDENPVYRSVVDDVYLTIESLSVDAPSDKGGCGSVITTTNVIISMLLLAGASLVVKKKD